MLTDDDGRVFCDLCGRATQLAPYRQIEANDDVRDLIDRHHEVYGVQRKKVSAGRPRMTDAQRAAKVAAQAVESARRKRELRALERAGK